MFLRWILSCVLLGVTHMALAADAISYAQTIKGHIKPSPVCSNYAAMIDNITSGAMPDAVKVRQIDKIIDRADRLGCIVY